MNRLAELVRLAPTAASEPPWQEGYEKPFARSAQRAPKRASAVRFLSAVAALTVGKSLTALER